MDEAALNIEMDCIAKLANDESSPCLASPLHWTKQSDYTWTLSRLDGRVFLAVPEDERNILEDLGHISNISLCHKYDLTTQDLIHLLTILAQADLLDLPSALSTTKAHHDHHERLSIWQSCRSYFFNYFPSSFLNYLLNFFPKWFSNYFLNHSLKNSSNSSLPSSLKPSRKFYWEGLWCKIPLGSPRLWLGHCSNFWQKIQTRWVWLSGFMALTAVVAWCHPRAMAAIAVSPLTFSVMVWGAILLITLCHELAHSLSLQHYGLPVSEWGIVGMLGLVGIYVDLSPIYHLVNPWQRLHVLLAGIWFQGVIAAGAWWLAQMPWLNFPWLPWQWWWQIVCWIGWGSLLWNLNPLVRTDGYYALVTWTQCWNLQAVSWELYVMAWRRKCLPWCFGASPWVVAYVPACVGYGVMMISLWVMTWG